MPRVTPADIEALAAWLIVDAIELEVALEDAAINDGRLSARVFNTQHRQIVVTRAQLARRLRYIALLLKGIPEIEPSARLVARRHAGAPG
jgi:hypothetical protein